MSWQEDSLGGMVLKTLFKDPIMKWRDGRHSIRAVKSITVAVICN